MSTKIEDMARISGATDYEGGRSETIFCFTQEELQNFAEKIVREAAKVGQKLVKNDYCVENVILLNFGLKK